MAIDLNGSATGLNFQTSYREEDPAVSVVSTSVVVGTGSGTQNSDGIVRIRIQLDSPVAGDRWQITSLPSGFIVSATVGGPALTLPLSVNAQQQSVLYVRSTQAVTDVGWQQALKAVKFHTDETSGGQRVVRFVATNAQGIDQAPVLTFISLIPVNDTPEPVADQAVTQEAGGLNNGTTSPNPSGNVLANDVDDDAGAVLRVSAIATAGGTAGAVGAVLQGSYGSLLINASGQYTYTVNQNHAAVEALRTSAQTLTDSFVYTVADQANASATSTLSITIQGRNDTPRDIALGRSFNGTAADVVVGASPFGVMRDFSFEIKVSPTANITLMAQSTTGGAGMTGQQYAVAPEHGYNTWGSTDHAGVGLSVGTNGISVYQWTLNLIAPLLTWAGPVNANTRVAVVFVDNRPTLYVNGLAVATGLQSQKLLHPTARLGGIVWGHYNGSLSDYAVWDEALSASVVADRASGTLPAPGPAPDLSMLSIGVIENAAAGTVVTTARARDVDAGDTLSYALQDNAQGRFVIDATTGVISTAAGAVFDHEAQTQHTVLVRVTDAAGQIVLRSLTIPVADLNEHPVLVADALDVAPAPLALLLDEGHHLWWLNLDTGERVQGATVGVSTIEALARNDAGVVYAVGGNTLYRVEPTTGQCTAVVALSGAGLPMLVGLTAASDGLLYAVDTVANLYRLDPATGLLVLLHAYNASISHHGDVVFLNGALYWTTPFGDLLRHNLVTQATSVAMTGLPTHPSGLGALWSLMVGPNGTLYTVDGTFNELYAIDLAAGTVSSEPLATPGGFSIDGTRVLPQGNVLANDPKGDAGDIHTVTQVQFGGQTFAPGTAIAGAHGTLTLAADGSYTYALNASDPAVLALAHLGQTLQEQFTYTVTDSAGKSTAGQLTVTIRGDNDGPQALADVANAVEAGGVANATAGTDPSGNVLANDTDPDLGDTLTVVDAQSQFNLMRNGSFEEFWSTYPNGGWWAWGVPHWSNPADAMDIRVGQARSDGRVALEIDSRGAADSLQQLGIATQTGQAYRLQFDVAGRAGALGQRVDVYWNNQLVGSVAPGTTDWTTASFDVVALGNDTLRFAEDAAQSTDWAGPFLDNVRLYHSGVGELLQGTYGTLQLNADGSYHYTVDQAHASVQALRTAQDTLSETFTYTVVDAAGLSSQSTLTITIQGQNDNPTMTDSTAIAVEAGGVHNATPGTNPQGNVIQGHHGDVDDNDGKLIVGLAQGTNTAPLDGTVVEGVPAMVLVGQYGTLVMTVQGDYTYTVDNTLAAVEALRMPEQTLTEVFSVTLSDAAGATVTSALTITLRGSDDAPVAVDDAIQMPASVASLPNALGIYPAGTYGNVLDNDTDVDADDLKFVSAVSDGIGTPGSTQYPGPAGHAVIVGQYGTLTLGDTGAYTYDLDVLDPAVQALRTPDQVLVESFQYQVTDALGAADMGTLTVTLTGVNDAPHAHADTGTAVEAGGVNNATPGLNPSGNVLLNDTDVDAGDTRTVTEVLHQGMGGLVGQALQGSYGALTLQADGSYTYSVDQAHAAVQALRTAQDTLSDTFTYRVTDTDGLSSSTTLTITLQGQDDTPSDILVGDPQAPNPIHPGLLLGGYSNFSVELAVSPTTTIELHAATLIGVSGVTGQNYAVVPANGPDVWGSNEHAGVGLSVGSNGISVYQRAGNPFAPLLTWAGAVGDNTHVAVVFTNNTPTLYVNGVAVATGLHSSKTLHPGVELAGGPGGGFSGERSDFRVWDHALSEAQVQANRERDVSAGEPGLLHAVLDSIVAENSAPGTPVMRVFALDVDSGETQTYTLANDAGGRFVIDAASGAVSVAEGAVLDHEQADRHTITVRATDAAGQWVERSFTVRVGDANDAPTSAGGEGSMNEDNQVRLDAVREPDTDFGQGLEPAVRITALPPGGTLTLDGVPVLPNQLMSAADALRMQFTPTLFTVAAFGFADQDPGDTLGAVRIAQLPDPAQGELRFNGVPVAADQVIAVADIGQLGFVPASNFNGDASFTYRVIDSRGAEQASASTFTVQVLAVNDTPVIDPIVAIDVYKNASTRLDGLAFGDVDDNGGPMAVTLSVSEGQLVALAGSGVTVEGSGTDTLVLRGTRDALNTFVQGSMGVLYQAPNHEPAAMSAEVQRIDPDPQASDPIVRMVYRTDEGHFEAVPASGLVFSGNGTNELSIEGPASAVAAYAAETEHVQRVAPLNQAELTVRLDDGGLTGADPGLTGTDTNEQDTRVIALNLVPQGVPLAPPTHESALTGAPVESTHYAWLAGLAVGAPLVIGLGLIDRIKGWFAGGDAAPADAVDYGRAWDEFGEQMHRLRGDGLHFIRTLPEPLITPTAGAPSAATAGGLLALFVALVTGGTLNVLLATKQLPVREGFIPPAGTDPHVNQTPTVTAPDTLDGTEDHALRLSGVHLSDPDAGDGTVSLTFEVAEGMGVFEAMGTAQVQVTGNFSTHLTLLGSVTALNAFLSAEPGVSFLPDADVNGPVPLSVTLNDLGNTGTDPGTSGDNRSEEDAIVIEADLAPVSDAPDGADRTVPVIADTALVLLPQLFGFSDVDGDSFIGVQIASLPAQGWLLLNGAPVALGTMVDFFSLNAGAFVYLPDAEAPAPASPPRLGFRVLDSGSTDNDGQVVAAHERFLDFDLLYRPTLDSGDTALAYHEANGQSLAWLPTVQVADRNAPVQRLHAVDIQAEGLGFGDTWGLDPVWLQTLAGAGPLPFEIEQLAADRMRITFPDGATVTTVQQLLQALVFDVDAPNATEGSRRFYVTVEDTDFLQSEPLAIDIAVTSVLGDALRALQAAHEALAQQVDAGASDTAGLRNGVLAWFDARATLAGAVWDVLSLAPAQDGWIGFGAQIREALDALATQAPTPLDAIAQPDIQTTLMPWFTPSAVGGEHLRLPDNALPDWLLRVVQAHTHALQGLYAETQALAQPTGAIGEGAAVEALRIAHGQDLLDALARIGIEPAVLSGGSDPLAALQTSGAAWVIDAGGELWLRPSQHGRLAQDIEHARLQQLHPALVPLDEALAALLAPGHSENGVLHHPGELLGLLRAVGLGLEPPVAIGAGDDPVAALARPGQLGTAPDGSLLMSAATQQVLVQALFDAALAREHLATPAAALSEALSALQPQGGAIAIPADLVERIEAIDLSVRLSTDAAELARRGTAVFNEADGSWSVSADTLAGWVRQLDAIGALVGAVAPHAASHGSALIALAALQDAAVQTLGGQDYAEVAWSSVLASLMQSHGVPVHIAVGYSPAERDLLLVPRAQAEPGLALQIDASHVLLPLAARDALLRAAHQALDASGLPLGDGPAAEPAFPADPAPAEPTPAQALAQAQAAQWRSDVLTDSNTPEMATTLDQWRRIGQALAPTLEQRFVTALDSAEQPVVVRAIDGLALPWLAALRDSGIAIQTVTPQALADAPDSAPDNGPWLVALDASGQALMRPAHADALANTLQAQHHAARAALAEQLLERLLRGAGDATLNVVGTDGLLHPFGAGDAASAGLVLLPRAALRALGLLGIEAPQTLLDSATPHLATDLAALGSQPGTLISDSSRGLALMSQASWEALVQAASLQRIAADVARHAQDPAVIAGQTTALALALDSAGLAAVRAALDAATPAGDGLLRVSATVQQLLRAGLPVHLAGDFGATPDDALALRDAPLLTAQTDPAQPGTLLLGSDTVAQLQQLGAHWHGVAQAVLAGTLTLPATDLAQPWSVHRVLSLAWGGADDAVVTVPADASFLADLLALGLSPDVIGHADSLAAADLATLDAALAGTAQGVVTVGDGHLLRVSGDTLQAWRDAVSDALLARGGAALLGGWQAAGNDPVPTVPAATDWSARSAAVAACDALTDFIDAFALQGQALAIPGGLLWSWAGDSAASVLDNWLQHAGEMPLDLGLIDPQDSSVQTLLNQGGMVVGHDASGALWANQDVRRALLDQLQHNAGLARETLRQAALDSLAGHPVSQGAARWADGELVHLLQRLDLLDPDTLRLTGVPGAPGFALENGNTLALSADARDALITRLGALAPALATAPEQAAQQAARQAWLERLADAAEDPSLSPEGLVVLAPSATALAGLATLGLFGLQLRDLADTALGRQGLAHLAQDTVLLAADGRLLMQPATLVMLHAQLQGLLQSEADAAPLPLGDAAHVLIALHGMQALDGDAAAALPALGIDWQASLAGWQVLGADAIATLTAAVGGNLPGALASFLQAQGLPLRFVDAASASALQQALADTGLHHPFTVLQTAAGDWLVSADTAQRVGAQLLDWLDAGQGIDWRAHFGEEAGVRNATAGWFAPAEDGSGIERRAIGQSASELSDQVLDEAHASAANAFAQLLRINESLSGGSGPEVRLGDGGAASAVALFLSALASFGLPHNVAEEVPGTTSPLQHGQYVVENGQLRMGADTRLALLEAADLLLRSVQVEQTERVVSELVQHSFAGSPTLPFITVAGGTVVDSFLDARGVELLTLPASQGGASTTGLAELTQACLQARNSLDTAALITLKDLQGNAFQASAADITAAWDRLAQGQAYLTDTQGARIVGLTLRDALLDSALTDQDAGQALIAQHLRAGLDAATVNGAEALVVCYGLPGLLDRLDIPHLLASDTQGLGQPGALLPLGNDSYALSSATLAALQQQVQQHSLHSAGQQERLSALLQDAELLYDAAAWLAQVADDRLASRLAFTAGEITGRLVLEITLPDAVLQALQTTHALLPATLDTMGSAQADYDALYTTGQVRLGSGAPVGHSTLVMTQDSWTDLLGRLFATHTPAGHGVALVAQADIEVLLHSATGHGAYVTTTLRVDGTDVSHIDDFAALATALRDAPAGTVFIDDRQQVWMATDTLRALDLAARAGAAAQNRPLLELTPADTGELLARYQALMPRFDGTEAPQPVPGDDSGWQGFSLDAADLGHLAALGVVLTNRDNHPGGPPQLGFDPVYSTRTDGQGTVWIDQRTYEALSDRLQADGHALIGSLFQNTWERLSTVDGNGATQVWWRSTTVFGDAFEQAADLAGLGLQPRSATNGVDPVADLAAHPQSFLRDPLGRILVSDATHQAVQVALDRLGLSADSAYLQQAMAALSDHELSPGLVLVRVTDPGLQAQLQGSALVTIGSGPASLGDISGAQIAQLNDRSTVFVLDDGQGSYFLTREAAQRLATHAATPIAELASAELAMPEAPAVVRVRGAQAGEFIATRLGTQPVHFLDAQGQPVDTALVDGQALTPAQRQWLHDHPGQVVADRNGHLLMSAETYEDVSRAAAQQLGRSDHQIVQALLAGIDGAPVHSASAGALSGDIATLPGPASAWLDLLRATQLPLDTAVLPGDGAGGTDFSALLDPASPVVGIDQQNRLVMSTALRDVLLHELAGLSGLTQQIAASGPGLVDPAALGLGAFDAALHAPSASLYYETAVGSAGWARAYGVATGARAYLNSDLYLEGKYGSMYEKLLSEVFTNPPTADELRQHRGLPFEFVLMAHLRQDVFTPREVVRIIDDDDYELEDVQTILDQVSVMHDVNALREQMPNPQDVAGTLLDLVSPVQNWMGGLQTSLADFRLDPDNVVTHLGLGVAYAGFAGDLRNALGQLGELGDRTLAVAPQVAHRIEALAPDIAALRAALDHAATLDLGGDDGLAFEREIGQIWTAAQQLFTQAGDTYRDIFGRPDEVNTGLSNAVLSALKESKAANDEIGNQAKVLQQNRFVASLMRLATQVPASIVDGLLQQRKADSLLGDSPAADALRKQYEWAAYAAYGAAVAGATSAAQVPAQFFADRWLYTGTAPTWTWSTFVENVGKTAVLGTGFVSPGYYLDHATRLPMRELIKARLYEAVEKANLDAISTNNNKLTGTVFFLANAAGVLGGIAQALQGAFTPTPVGTYLAFRGATSALVSVPSLLADLWGALASSAEWRNRAAYMNAVGHVGLQIGLPLLDALGYSTVYALHGADGGVGLGTVLNALFGAASYGVGLGVLGLNWAWLVPMLVSANIDFTAVLAAVQDLSRYNELSAEGRTVEAGVAWADWKRNVAKSIPWLNGFSWLIGAIHDLPFGTPTELTRGEYELAVIERLHSLENNADEAARPSQQALAMAQALGAEEAFYLVQGMVDDFPYQINDGIRVIKSVVVNQVIDGVASTEAQVNFYDSTVNISGADNNFRNEAVIRVALPNDGTRTMTVMIAPELSVPLPLITDPVKGPNMLVDASGSAATATNRFLVFNPHAAILGGAGNDEYLLMQALQPGLNSAGKRITGYIVDGWSGSGVDRVDFSLAEQGQGIHTALSYNGLSAYDGLRQFVGSAQADLFTRYAAQRSDAAVMLEGGDGAQADRFDLRGGNNLVSLGSGTVLFNQTTRAQAGEQALAVLGADTLEAQRALGPWKNDSSGYDALFANTFDARNFNVVTVTESPAAAPWLAVHGHALASDTLAFSLYHQGIDLRFSAGGGSGPAGQNVPVESYQWRALADGESGPLLGFADNAIDTLIGSQFSDRIVIDGSSAAIGTVQGNGGDDFIRVNRANLVVETSDGRSEVVLDADTAGTDVFAGVGTRVTLFTQVAAPTADDRVLVALDHRLPGLAPDNEATQVDASESNAALMVRADAGALTIDLGLGDATVEIGVGVRSVHIRDTSASLGELKLLFRDLDGDFSVNELFSLGGAAGLFTDTTATGTGMQSLQAVWKAGNGEEVSITLEADASALGAISIGSVFAESATYRTLNDLVA